MKVEFDLLANAIDSIDRAIELVAWGDDQGDARRLKQSVQAIAHGIELLLKERLRRIHPAFLWENIEKYPSLSARTVTAESAIARLMNIGSIRFAKEDLELIRSLRATRNAVEHYAWNTTKQEAEQIIAKALAFALEFSSKNLSYAFFGYHTRKDDTFQSLLASSPAFAAALSARKNYHDDVDSAESEEQCSFCRAVAFNRKAGACRICGHWQWPKWEQEDDGIPF